jgi:hypothetical protein
MYNKRCINYNFKLINIYINLVISSIIKSINVYLNLIITIYLLLSKRNFLLYLNIN